MKYWENIVWSDHNKTEVFGSHNTHNGFFFFKDFMALLAFIYHQKDRKVGQRENVEGMQQMVRGQALNLQPLQEDKRRTSGAAY